MPTCLRATHRQKRFKPKKMVSVSREARAQIEAACRQAGLTEVPPSLLVCSVKEPICATCTPDDRRGAKSRHNPNQDGRSQTQRRPHSDACHQMPSFL